MKKISKIMLCSVGLLMAAENVWASGEPAASSARRVAPNEVVIHFDVPAGKELAWQRGKGKLFVKFYAEAKGLRKAGYASYIERPVDKEDMVFAISDVGMYQASWEFNRKSVLLTEFTYNGTSIVDGDNLPLGVINVPYNGEGVPVIAYAPVRHVDVVASSTPVASLTGAQKQKLALDQAREKGDMALKAAAAEDRRQKQEIARLAELRRAELLRQAEEDAAAEKARQQAKDESAAATTIQSVARGNQVRKKLDDDARVKAEEVRVAAAEDARQKEVARVAEVEAQARQQDAAIKIQSKARQKAAVKTLREKKAAALEAHRKAEEAVRAAAVAEQASKDATIRLKAEEEAHAAAEAVRLRAEEDAASTAGVRGHTGLFADILNAIDQDMNTAETAAKAAHAAATGAIQAAKEGRFVDARTAADRAGVEATGAHAAAESISNRKEMIFHTLADTSGRPAALRYSDARLIRARAASAAADASYEAALKVT